MHDEDDEPSRGALEAGREALTPMLPAHAVDSAPAEAPVRTDFAAATGPRLRTAAIGAALFLLVAFLVVALVKWRAQSALASETRTGSEGAITVTVTAARPAGGERQLTLPGETAAWYESTIYGRVNGYVARWYADIGDHVRQGQLLATIDTPELDAQLAAARAQLNAAQSQVHVREAEAELATTTYERWRDSPKGVVSEQEREEKRAGFDSAAALLTAARAQVAVSQADVDRYAALAEFKRVVAPFDGVIVERRIDIGNLVTAGSTAATTSLYRMSQDNPIRIFVDVPQRASGDLMHPGVPVQIRASNLPGQVFSGTLTRAAQAINPQARTMRVEVDLPNREQRLVPGMYVDVAFDLAGGGLVQVPAAALVFRSSGPQVAVVETDGHIRFRKVTIGRDDGNVVEIGSGVHSGERVALNVSGQLVDGDPVVAQELNVPGAPATTPTAPARSGS